MIVVLLESRIIVVSKVETIVPPNIDDNITRTLKFYIFKFLDLLLKHLGPINTLLKRS